MEAQPSYCINMVSSAFLQQCKQATPNAKCYLQQQPQTFKLRQTKTHLKRTGLEYLSSSQKGSQCKMRIYCALMQSGQCADYI